MARERLGPLRVAAGQPPEARRADVRLEQVLLEEHPGVHVRALDRVGGEERRALGEVEQDRARLGDRAAVDLEQRRPPGRVAGEVLVGLGVAGEDVGGDPLVRKAELREQHPHLEAVGRGREVVESESRGRGFSLLGSSLSCRRKRSCHAVCEMQPRERLSPLRPPFAGPRVSCGGDRGDARGRSGVPCDQAHREAHRSADRPRRRPTCGPATAAARGSRSSGCSTRSSPPAST